MSAKEWVKPNLAESEFLYAMAIILMTHVSILNIGRGLYLPASITIIVAVYYGVKFCTALVVLFTRDKSKEPVK